MERIRVIVVAGCLIAVVAAVPTPSGLAAPPVQPRSVAATSTLAVITTIGVGSAPWGVAVDEGDDTVYVTNLGSGTVSVINGRTRTVAGTITVGGNPYGVAVNDGDDTVYVPNFNSDNMSVINGRTRTVAGTITVGDGPYGVAVDQRDDTVYVPNLNGSTVSVINGRSLDDSVTIPVGATAFGVAVDQGDDTVYVTNFGSGTVSVINGRLGVLTDDTITVGGNPSYAAVNEGDDTVYVTNQGSNSVWVINGRTRTVDDTITVGGNPHGVAVDQRDDTVYVTNQGSGTVSVINGRTRTVDDTITVGGNPVGVAVDDSGTNAGLVYVTNGVNMMLVIARVSASLGSVSGLAGSTVTVLLDVPQVDYDVDGSTVTSVSFGDDTATGLTAAAGDSWTLTVPAGSGTVPVTVTFKGGLTASAGSFTYPPPPPAVFPPSAPGDVVGVPGDREAGLSWTAPADAGSFPISTYQAVVSPGGQSCLVAAPAVTCTISGLTNGTTYTATVRALNGAGWGPYSTASAAFTPQAPVVPSITITGTRGEVRDKPGVLVTGTTTGFEMGAILRPWTRFPGQTSYTQGTASILVDAQGGFTWDRRTGKTIYILIRSEDGTVESNRLILRAT
jgi:YVTN family beta-propeller protein